MNLYTAKDELENPPRVWLLELMAEGAVLLAIGAALVVLLD
jgi:hypothetical protein